MTIRQLAEQISLSIMKNRRQKEIKQNGHLFLFFGIRILESFFVKTNGKLFDSYFFGIMGFLIIDVVCGGQTMVFLR